MVKNFSYGVCFDLVATAVQRPLVKQMKFHKVVSGSRLLDKTLLNIQGWKIYGDTHLKTHITRAARFWVKELY